MIPISKNVFKNKYDDTTLENWYENLMLPRIQKKYSNTKKGLGKPKRELYDDNTTYIENIIKPFLSDAAGSLDEEFIKLLLTGDIIGKYSNYESQSEKLDAYFYLRFFAYYHLDKIKIDESISLQMSIHRYLSQIKKQVTEFNKRILHTHVQVQLVANYLDVKNWVIKNYAISNLKANTEIAKGIKKYTYDKLKVELQSKSKYIYICNGTQIRELFFKDVSRFDNMLAFFVDYSMLKENEGHIICTTLDIRVCPYCNRQYITWYENKNSKSSTADIDHFFAQSKFQLFSLSLYNMVPACQICNSRMKLEKAVEIFYPYTDDAKCETTFQIKMESFSAEDWYKTIYGDKDSCQLKNFSLKLTAKGHGADKMEGTIELFRLREIYQAHKNYVAEIVRTKSKYDNDNALYILDKEEKSQLESVLSHTNNYSEISEKEKNRILYGIEETNDELHNKPLIKLTMDILKQLS